MLSNPGRRPSSRSGSSIRLVRRRRSRWPCVGASRSSGAGRCGLSGLTEVSAASPAAGRSRMRSSVPSTRHASTKRALFTTIRSDAHRTGWSIRALADRHGVHRRTVQRALNYPIPPPRKQQPARGSRLDPFKQVIDAILQADDGSRYAGRLSIQSIYTTLVAEHGMIAVSYSTLRDCVTNHCRRLSIPLPPANSITPLHQAVEHDNHRQTGEPAHADITAFLPARGADPQHTGPDNTTPLRDAETPRSLARPPRSSAPGPPSPGFRQ